MPSCREVTRLVSQGLDRELGLAERTALRLHFAICRGCNRFNDQMHFLRKAVRGLADAGHGERDRDKPDGG